MSPWSSERVLISLEPSAVHVVQLAGHLARRVVDRTCLPAIASAGAAPWEAAVEALRSAVTGLRLRGVGTVVLSNGLVRYAVVQHAERLSRADERDVLARAHFAKVHGNRAGTWTVRMAGGGKGRPSLAVAVDTALLQAVGACFTDHRRLRLASIQPYAVSAFNCWRRLVPERGAWFVLPEHDRVCLALIEGERWTSVTTSREVRDTGVEGYLAAVARERVRLAAAEYPVLVALAGVGGAESDAGSGFEVRPLPLEGDDYGMAMTAR